MCALDELPHILRSDPTWITAICRGHFAMDRIVKRMIPRPLDRASFGFLGVSGIVGPSRRPNLLSMSLAPFPHVLVWTHAAHVIGLIRLGQAVF
jgi:hypothetical protein